MASYIEQFVEVQEELLIVGDFNIHVDSSNNESQSFLDILNANGLIQYVKSSTHQKGHILDLVITLEHSNLLKRPPVVFISGVSDVKSSSSLDHFAVLCYLNVNRPKTIHKSVKFRAFRNIPVPDYRNDVKLLMCNRRKSQKNSDDLINNYNLTLQKLTDKYAPLQCKTNNNNNNICLKCALQLLCTMYYVLCIIIYFHCICPTATPCTLVHKCITSGKKGAQVE